LENPEFVYSSGMSSDESTEASAADVDTFMLAQHHVVNVCHAYQVQPPLQQPLQQPNENAFDFNQLHAAAASNKSLLSYH
jgi:hypothetical protein